MNQNTENTDNIDIKKYYYLFLRKWYWFALAVAVNVAIAFLYLRYSNPVYQTTNSVFLSEKEDALGAMGSIMKEFGGSIGGKGQNVDNQIGILSSYSLTRKTLERLNYRVSYFDKGRVHDVEIYESCPFFVFVDTTYAQVENEEIFVTILSEKECLIEIPRKNNTISQKVLFGSDFVYEDYKFKIEKKDLLTQEYVDETYKIVVNNYHSLTKSYLENITVESSFKKGTILQLIAKGPVPYKLVEFLNTLIQVAIENDLAEKNATSVKTIEFIDIQLSSVVDSLSLAENNLEAFRSANKVINLSVEGTELFKSVEELQKNKSLSDVKLSYYKYILQTIKEKNSVKDITTPSVLGIQDPLLNNLVGELSKLYSERQVLEYSATPNNPSLQIVNVKIKNAISSLEQNINNLIQSAKIEQAGLNKDITKIDSKLHKLPNTERKFINIQRKFLLNDNIYNFLLQKRAEVGITKAANLSDLKFIDFAVLDNVEMISPNKKISVLLALFLALLIPGGIILARDLLNDKIQDKDEITKFTSIPVLGFVAHNRYVNDTIVVNKHPKSSITESFRAIRSSLSFFIKTKQTPIISFTSTISGEGKTFCALNLAGIIAMNNKKVLIVGLDLRKPRLQAMLQSSKLYGVTDYLIGKATLEDIIVKTEVKNLNIIYSGTVPPNPIELMESAEFAQFFKLLKEKGYDYIILDTPPIGLVADTFSISNYADMNVFVMRQNYSHRNSVNFINEVKADHKLDNIAILLNDVDLGGGYGYGYGNYGTNKHGYYEESIEEKKLTFVEKVTSWFS